MLSTRTKKLLAVAGFSAIFLVTRIPFLGYDEINPDAVNWHFRSEQFIVGLKSGDFLKTYQHYHPGVTLMWVMGVPIEMARQIDPSFRVYNQDNFLRLHQIAKYSLITVQLALSVGLILALKDILGFKKSLLAVVLFSFEPFFLGNSRLLHMDVLLTLFVVLSLTYAYKFYLRRTATSVVLSGVFAGLAFLTKSVGILSLGFILAFLTVSTLRNRVDIKRSMVYLGAFLLSSVAIIFLLFPALWVNPKFVLSDIYNEGLRIGTRRGHEQVVMGSATDVAGPSFYPLVLVLKTSPLVWFGVALFIFQLLRNHRRYQSVDKKFILYLSIFYLVYFLGVTLASKKIDRYMVPLFPLLGIIASIGITQAFATVLVNQRRQLTQAVCCTSYKKDRYVKPALYFSLVLVTGIGVLYPLLKLYPYYFTYTNPFFRSAENANRIIGQKPFGIGIPELKSQLIKKYGEDVSLGFIDKKPMSMIYQNSKLFDIRETGTSKYNLIILGPNEEMPQNVLDGKFKFVQDDAMYINGLEFWRIYIHEPKKVI